MKNRKKLIYIFIVGIALVSCTDETLDEIDTNPNLVTDAPLNSLLPQGIITYSHEVVGGSGAIYAGFMSEQTTHVLGTNAYDKFDSYNSQPWENAYLLINDLNFLKNKAVSNEAWSYAGIADVLKAFTLTTLIDLFGDIPYSEAVSINIRAPKFDPHEELYPVIFDILDEAIANLEKNEGPIFPTTDDLVFGGDKAMWKKTAYGLKARLYNKLVKLNPTGSVQDALNALSKSFVNGEENFMISIFNDSPQNGNPLSVAQELQPQSAIGNGTFNAMLFFTPNNTIEEDPRSVIWITTVNGERLPAPNGTADADFGDPRMDGALYSKPEILKFKGAPFPILNYVELLFIKAEAHHRLGNSSEAYAAYQEAVQLALEQAAIFNPSAALDPADITNYLSYPSVSPGEGNLTLETIILQKYIYYFQYQWIEAYNESRRTGFILATNPLDRGNRMIYPNSEIVRNPNTPSEINFFSIFESSTKLVWAE